MARGVSGRLTAEALLRATLDPAPPAVFWLWIGVVGGVWLPLGVCVAVVSVGAGVFSLFPFVFSMLLLLR
jgi:hypothetical protein